LSSQIFESTKEVAEIGAALTVPENAVRVLKRFGYNKENLNSVDYDDVRPFPPIFIIINGHISR
jgi:hypothetical protein